MFKFVKARNFFSRLKLNKKFLLMYIFGVILPLIITDAVLFRSVYDAELSNQRNYRKNAIDAYSNHIQSVLQYDANVATAIDLNKDLNSFIDTEYDIPYGYFNSYVYTVSTSFFATLSDIKQDRIVIYSDNESMMSGHYFHNIKEAYNEKWYEQFVKTDANEAAYAYYDSDPIVLTTDRDRFIYVRKMDNAKSALKLTRIITIEHKMTRIYDELKEIPVNCQMYLCCGDYIIYPSGVSEDEFRQVVARSAYSPYVTVEDVHMYDNTFTIYAVTEDLTILKVIREHILLTILMILFTLILLVTAASKLWLYIAPPTFEVPSPESERLSSKKLFEIVTYESLLYTADS